MSPKAGLEWSPGKETHLRSYYAQSLGGVFFDNSVRLEPTQIAGFNQAFRSLIPESVLGLVPGTRFETWGVGVDQTFRKTGTYLLAEAQFLNSDATRTVGVLTNSDPIAPFPDSPASTRQSLDYFEKSLLVAANQLLGEHWSLGARYKLTHSDLHGRYPGLPSGTTGASGLEHVSGSLHQLTLEATCYLRCGFFAQFERMRSETDHRFVMKHPLLAYEQFKPEMLVGDGMSFFGSTSNSMPSGFIGNDPSKQVQCCVACDKERGMLIIVRDPGPGFDPDSIPSPVVGQNVFSTGGRGIYLINQLMDDVRFERGGTEIHMRKDPPP